MSENEHEGVELLLRDPEIVAWLELDESEHEDEGDVMHGRFVQPKRGREILVRPLLPDTATVQAVFNLLGEASRRARFNGSKPRLPDDELRRLSAVDAMHHALGRLEVRVDGPETFVRALLPGTS